MVYISEEMRQQARIDLFRKALTSAGDKQGPHQTLKDFGITDPIDKEQMQDVAHVYGGELVREQQEEDAFLGIPSEPVEEPPQGMSGMMARLVMAVRSERQKRAQVIVSRNSTAASFDNGEQAPKQHKISLDFHRRALDPRSNADPEARDVNAVRMIMENIGDWDFHARHDGDTLTSEAFLRVIKLLEMNLRATCPSVKDYQALESLVALKHGGHLDDMVNLRHMTERTVAAYLDAQNNKPQTLAALNKFMSRSLAYYERFYGTDRPAHVPMRTLAQALERQGDRPAASARLKPV